MRILVTGGAGYLGSVLVPKLLVRGHQVRVLDAGYFGTSHILATGRVELIKDDIRKFDSDKAFRDAALDGCDGVIHLASLSNDPSAELDADLTHQVNYLATVAIGAAARERGLPFIFSSSCAVYGAADRVSAEGDGCNPLTAYAISKMRAEQDLTGMATDDWRPIILRCGTLFGASPRMRFDLVVNTFAQRSWERNQIEILGGGLQWRPYLHVADCARAMVFFIEKRRGDHLVYNVAHSNSRLVDVAECARAINPMLEVQYVGEPNVDRRNYRVTTTRLNAEGFNAVIDVMRGMEEVTDVLARGWIVRSTPKHFTASWMKEILRTGHIPSEDEMMRLERGLDAGYTGSNGQKPHRAEGDVAPSHATTAPRDPGNER